MKPARRFNQDCADAGGDHADKALALSPLEQLPTQPANRVKPIGPEDGDGAETQSGSSGHR